MSSQAPAKVYAHVTKLLKANLIKNPPAWYPATSIAPPSPTFLRQRDVSGIPLTGELPFEQKQREEKEKEAKKAAKAAGEPYVAPSAKATPLLSRSARSIKHLRYKAERPKQIVYPEDRLRRRFYEDHPWELRRPRSMIETTGNGTQREWSSLLQPNRALSELTGEDVIQYQMFLMSKGHSEREAYSMATSEFYKLRAQEETEVRVAREQAVAFGAKPRKNFVQNGLKREEEALLRAHSVDRL
ncbi:mitochondrial ribosomal small subunit component [Actinomortierella ambigua]|nr:mitochondrial ribosomal small subunit component [Actinomortierella ambigua]